MAARTRRRLSFLLFFFFATAAPSQVPHRDEYYLGQMIFFRVDVATVVYPAGPGTDPERNRISAEHRARFLESAFGVQTRVVSDAEVTEQDFNRHLLVLGWGNRLLGTEKAPRPFERGPGGTRFLGISESDPGADLMMFHPSPYHPDRWMLFWSRLDPVRDRFMPLPTVGSDWAMYRDFKIIRQGMLRPGTDWPPERDPEAEKNHVPEIESARATWTHRQSSHYEIFYDPAKISTDEADRILKARETAFSKAASALGAPAEGYRVRLFIYDKEEEKKWLTGVPDTAHALPSKRELHMVRRTARSSSPHEEYHLLAHERLGPCVVSGLYEGLAVSLEGSYAGLNLDVIGAAMLEKDVFPGLDDALDEETLRKGPVDTVMAVAGLAVSWLRATLDPPAFARAYAMPEWTAAALQKAVGRPASVLRADFRGWVTERAAARAADIAFYKADAEAQERLLVGDYAGAATALARAHEIRPTDPQTLFNLASAQMRADAYAKAEGNLERLLELPLESADRRFVIFGHYQLGRVYDVQGRRKDALAQYRRVLELPDLHDAHRLAREAMETPVTKEQLQ